MPPSKEFDDAFSFDVPGMTTGGARSSKASPWEFGSALANARTDGATGATTIDDKIAARLARKSSGRKRGRGHESSSSDESGSDESESESDDDGENSGSSDDDDDDDDVASSSSDEDDDEEEEADSSDESSSSEEDEGEAPARRKGAGAAAAAPPTPPSAKAATPASSSEEEEKDLDSDAEAGSDDASDDDDDASDDDDDEEEASDSEDEHSARARRQAADGARHSAQAAAEAGKRGASAAAPSSPASASFAPAPRGTAFSAASFAALQLSRPLLKACSALGYSRPTPIQAACIPLALLGRDIAGSAVTGSGKTAAFALPLLERLLLLGGGNGGKGGTSRGRLPATYVLILEPTRELAAQVHSMVCSLARFTDVRAALAVGGLSLQGQASDLRTKPEVVVATPGRLVDHLRNSPTFGLDDLQALVLDEADRLLDMGFRDEVEQIVRAAPRQRQTLLFSATLASAAVSRLVAASLTRPVRLAADAACAAPAALSHEVVRLKGAEGAAGREAAALALCASAAAAARVLASSSSKNEGGGGKEEEGASAAAKPSGGGALRRGRAILFFRTKASAHRAKILFGLAGLPRAAELHGNMTQAARLEALEAFRTGAASFLLATDVAARGLDVLGVEAVLNVDAPPDVAAYLHRAGRTARAGARGRVVTLAGDGDRALLKKVVRSAGVKLSARAVPAASLSLWRDAVARMEFDVSALARQEAEEAALRKAEMEATKAENMLAHGDEIRARAPRTWFQSPAERKRAAEAAKEEALADSLEGLSGEARKAKKREEQKKKRAEGRLTEKASRKKAKRDEALALASRATIRAVKSGARRLMMSEGITSGRAGKLAAASVLGRSADSSAKKKRDAKKKIARKAARESGGGGGGGGEDANGGGGGGLFSSTPVPPRSAKVYAGGGRSGALKISNSGAKKRSKEEAKRAARGGKGKSRFKSKAKHKRRK